MTKIVNSLSAKMEMGSPMACMYFLGNPDHYTNYSFVPFYWKSFVQEPRKPWDACQKSADVIPKDYHKFADVFDKKKADTLPPH